MTDTVTLTFGSGDDQRPIATMDIPRQLGHVRLVDEVGRGGMGVVWRGHDEFLKRDVAVKLLSRAVLGDDDVLRDQFIEGARAAAAVKHPNVVPVFHADQMEDVVFIVMEFVDGSTLREVLDRNKAVEPDLATLMTMQVLDALTAIHGAGVVHRDIKPTNVMFDRDGELRVSDFGLSYQRGAELPGGLSAGGTPPYMAPEMFTGDTSFQSDIYAVGIMYFEMLTGVRPFDGHTVDDFRIKHADFPVPEQPLERSGVAEGLREIIHRATNKKKIFRYKQAAHMLLALDRLHPRLRKDVVLDRKLKTLILDSADDGASSKKIRASDTPAATYFDLLSKIAHAKRDEKSDQDRT